MLAFFGSFGGQLLARRGARELDKRAKREEVLRVVRWASELAVSDDQRKAQLGVAELVVLLESALLDDDELAFVDAALAAVYEPAEEQIEQIEQAGDEAAVEVAPEYAGDEVDETSP